MKKILISVSLISIFFMSCKKDVVNDAFVDKTSQSISMVSSMPENIQFYKNVSRIDILNYISETYGINDLNEYDLNSPEYDLLINSTDFNAITSKPKFRWRLFNGCENFPAICLIITFFTPQVESTYLLEDGYSDGDLLKVDSDKLMIRSTDPIMNGITNDGFFVNSGELEFNNWNGYDKVIIHKGVYKAHLDNDGNFDYFIVNCTFE